jgi:acetoin utilization deacetylase AcuC-like enzyme
MNLSAILVWAPRYDTDLAALGIIKPFALDRGELVLQQLEKREGRPIPYLEPKAISEEDLLLVHSPEYLETLHKSETWKEIFELSDGEYFPDRAMRPLTDLLDDIKLKCGGTLLASELALKCGLAANLGGGYHHAFPDRGHGFCAIHDIAIAIRSLQKRKLIQRAMVVDLDFHQGDGTAAVFANDPTVFTLSVHSEEGWPEVKQKSSLDVGILSSETDLYLEKAAQALDSALKVFDPELVIYVAGSDPYELDVLPGTSFIKLSLQTMKQRDETVIDYFADRKIPLAMVFAGGYGPHVWEVHYQAVEHLLARAGVLGVQSTA